METSDPIENLTWYNEEMDDCANGYAAYILEQVEAAKETCKDPKVLKEELAAKGVLIENSEVELASFALLFEFDGDQKHIRHVMYNCSASRPGIEGKTNEDSKEVQTETLSIKATPLANGMVKAKTGNTTAAATYNGWYDTVYIPGATPTTPDTAGNEG